MVLRVVADGGFFRPFDAACIGFDVGKFFIKRAGQKFQQGGFARAVQAEDADFRAGEEGKGDVFQDEATTGDDFAHPVHGEYVLAHCFLRWL